MVKKKNVDLVKRTQVKKTFFCMVLFIVCHTQATCASGYLVQHAAASSPGYILVILCIIFIICIPDDVHNLLGIPKVQVMFIQGMNNRI